MYKIFGGLLFAGILVFSYSFFKSKNKIQKNEIVQSKQINGGFFQLSSLKKGVVARSGEITILEKDLATDPVLQAFQIEKSEWMLVQASQQILKKGLSDSKIVFFMDKPTRLLSEIYNQYGLLGLNEYEIFFAPAKDDLFVQAGKVKLKRSDIEKKSYQWGALETKIFYRYLKLIKEKIERIAITKKAKSMNMKTPEYIEKVVLKEKKELSIADKEEAISLHLKESILDLPIKVNLNSPQFDIELKPDWTPSVGPLKAKHKVQIFSDFYSQSARDIINKIEELAQSYPKVYFGFHPIFPHQNQYQNMLAEIGFCVWVKAPEKYWPFIKEALKARPKTFEKEVYKGVESVGLELKPIKDCFYKQEHKKVVSYHLDYAKYLGIQSGPVILVDGKVFSGGVPIKIIKNTLSDL